MQPTEPKPPGAAPDEPPATRREGPPSKAPPPPAPDPSTAPTPAVPSMRPRQTTQQEIQAISQEIKATAGYEPPPAEAAARLAASRAGEAASIAAAAATQVAEIKGKQEERDARSRNTNKWTKYGTVVTVLLLAWPEIKPKAEAWIVKHEGDNAYVGLLGIVLSLVSAYFIMLRLRPQAKGDEPKAQGQAGGEAPGETGKEA